ncbi:hypothetical protein [Arenibaculum pallidiluteum]|uniref:hypothetical protein n=1 Tax=Arenibaculum pallidiluteum TaxID=2812559 RepID=UPI001A97B7C8|nr:hypothetical protein [Arenibaculum pallidiluteum]
MRTLSIAAALIGILSVAPAFAGEGNPGVNQFHGASDLVSFGAQPNLQGPPPVAVRQEAVRSAQGFRSLVSGEAAIDPIYGNLSGQGWSKLAAGQPAASEMAFGETDFGRAFAN